MDESPGILLVRLKSLGDIVLALPAVHAVRAAFPTARLSFLVSKEYAPLLSGFQDVDSVLTLDRARFRGFHPKSAMMETLSLWRKLRRERFALAVDFQGYGETALLAWCSGAPKRLGFVSRPGRKWAYTHSVRRDPVLHPVESNLALVRQDTAPLVRVRNEFVLPESALVEARRFFAEHNLATAKPTLFIQPFTSSPHKDWPFERYLELARDWWRRGLQVLFGGGPADQLALSPAREAGFPVAAGAALLLSAGLVKLSTLVLGGNTGLLHLAVALDKRVIMLMDSRVPGNCPPFQHPEWAIVPPNGLGISALTLKEINDACTRAVQESTHTLSAT